jgi:hypothetical protein
MESEATQIFGGRRVVLNETDRALTPFGGMVVFLEFLNKIGFVKKVIECMRSPIDLRTRFLLPKPTSHF